MSRRVVITGMGAVTPLGNNVEQTWQNLIAGKSGVGPITIFDAKSFPTTIAGEVKNFNSERWTGQNGHQIFLGRNSLFALQATQEAFGDAGLSKAAINKSRLGIYFGAGDGGFDFKQYASIVSKSMDSKQTSVDAKAYLENSLKSVNAQVLLEQEPSEVVHHLSQTFGADGIVMNCLTACAASSQAIGEAMRLVRGGYADVMITGGTHSMIHPLGVAGFNLLTALSTRNDEPTKASRPFDKNRDGFVLSEGAGVVILEELEHALKRNAKIYAELVGYGGSADAFRLTDPHSEGRGAIQAIKLAIKDANTTPEKIDYINAHGTSTQLNDQVETLAVKQVFGAHAKSIPMSSIKSMLGHMIAAAGAVELVASILTIQKNIIPPTINYQTPDENCDLDYVPNKARHAQINTILSNSFGFGGQNIALVVKKYQG